MHSDIQWIEAIAPDMVDMLSRRYLVLRTINWMAPVGRRLLAQTLGVSERTLRTALVKKRLSSNIPKSV